MLQANTGSSVQKSAKAAGLEAASKAAGNLQNIKIAFVYASCAYPIHDVLAGVQEGLPNVPVIGNTSFTGVITPEGFVGGADGFVGIMAMADADLAVGTATVAKGSSAIEDGKKAAKKAMEAAGKSTPPDYFYMAASPGEEESYLKGITQVIGRIPFFGGSAADNTISGNWQLYSDKGVCSNGVGFSFRRRF